MLPNSKFGFQQCYNIYQKVIPPEAGSAMFCPSAPTPKGPAPTAGRRTQEHKVALLTFSHCSRHPAVSRPRQGGPPRGTAWRGAEPMTRPGPGGSTYLAVSKASCPLPKHSSLPKGTNICPNKKNQRASCRSSISEPRRKSSRNCTPSGAKVRTAT